MSKKATPAHRRIDESADAVRRFVIQPADRDLFVRTGKQIIDACRLNISVELWLEELQLMLAHVRNWAAGRSDVRSCHYAPRGSKVVFFFAPSSHRFSFELAADLAELNAQLAREFNIGIVEVQQVPWDELDRFLDSESARLLHGQPLRSPPAVEAQ